MTERILFNPDNRLLGTSTGDLGLYGGQVDPGIAFSAPSSDDAADLGQAPGSAGSDTITQQPNALAGLSTPAGASPADDITGVGALAPTSFLIAPATSFQPLTAPQQVEAVLGAGTPVAFTPAVPQAVGSGAPTPQAEAAATAPAQEAVATASSLGDVVGTAHTLPVLDGEAGILPAALGGLTVVTTPLTQEVAQVTDAVGTLVTTTLDSVGDLAGSALDGLGDVLASTVTALPAIAEPVDPVLDAVGTTLTSTVGAAVDTLSDLAGSNPEGGIATLVSLVSAADMFDLQPTNAPTVEAANGDLGFDLLDTLVGDESALGSLLGHDDHHNDAGGLFGGHDDSAHPLGL